MIGMTCLQAGAAQVDRADAVESLLGEIEQRRVAAGDADPDVVMQNIDAAPALVCRLYGRGERRFLGDVRLEGDAFTSGLFYHRRGFLGRGEIAVDSHDLGALLSESQHRGAAVAHSFAGALPGADDDGDLCF
jgi:hypothetical protein